MCGFPSLQHAFSFILFVLSSIDVFLIDVNLQFSGRVGRYTWESLGVDSSVGVGGLSCPFVSVGFIYVPWGAF